MKKSLGHMTEWITYLRQQLFGAWYPVTLTAIGLVSLSLSTGLSLHMRFEEHAAWDKSVALALTQHAKHFQESLTDLEDEIKGTSLVLAQAPVINQPFFDALASEKLKYFFGLAWVDLVTTSQALPADCVTAGPDIRYVIRYHTNQKSSHQLVNADLSCDRQRARAMNRALRTDQPQTSDLVSIYLSNAQGLIVAMPIWKPDAPGHAAGMLLATLEFEAVIDHMRTEMVNSQRYDLQIVDASQAGTPRFYPALALAPGGLPFAKADLFFAGRHLQLQMRPRAEKLRERNSHLPVVIFVAGLAVTLLLLLLLHSQVISRKRAEILSIVRSDDLVDRENRLAALFNHATIGIIRCDHQGRILQANRAAASMLDCPADTLLGQDMPSLFDPRSEARLRNRRHDLVTHVNELQLNSITGELVPVSVQILPLRSPNGEPYSWTLLEDLRDVRHAERMKMQFVSTISHELRTPLTVIRSSVELLSLESLSDDGKTLVQSAENNVLRLQQLIDNLLDMEQMKAGALSLTQKTHDIRPLLGHILGTVDPLLAQKQLQTRFVTPDQPLLAFVDDERLSQVVVNLMSNAIKFSPPASIITLKAEAQGEFVKLAIQDQGPGIPSTFQSRLFQPFAQAEGDDNRRWGGSGLGLYISYNLVKRMGGSLSLTSEPGLGACFTVLLPAHEACAGLAGEE